MAEPTLTTSDLDKMIISEKTSTKIEWEKNYTQYNKENLRTHNVIDEGGTYYLVSIHHPVSDLLDHNLNIVGLTPTTLKKSMVSPLDSKQIYLKMSKQVFDLTCKTLEEQVLPMMEQEYFAEQLRRVRAILAKNEYLDDENPEKLVAILVDILKK